MRFATGIFLFFLAHSSFSQSSTKLTLDGKVLSERMYFQNPANPNDTGFCAHKVYINGKEAICDVNSSAFEIDFVLNGFKLNDSVHVEIHHKNDCSPSVIQSMHPPVRRPMFELISIELDTTGVLTWVTQKETTKMLYHVEQYRWNKWITVATVNCNGSDSVSTYTCEVDIHSGLNKFRVLQHVPLSNGGREISKMVEYTSHNKVPEMSMDHKNQTITFSRNTYFEVYTRHGDLLHVGKGNQANLNKVCRYNEDYYLNYDNSTISFYFKRR